MDISRSDLFWGMDDAFIAKVKNITIKQSLYTGDALFHFGDPALVSYILISGRIKLVIGDQAVTAHTVKHVGEVFGWSTLIGRPSYSASAYCMQPSGVYAIEGKKLLTIVENDPINGMKFYRRLVRMMGNRLVNVYRLLHPPYEEVPVSYGSGQQLAADVSEMQG